jgi:CubicO group peptidase (beta-lactamase class C family)
MRAFPHFIIPTLLVSCVTLPLTRAHADAPPPQDPVIAARRHLLDTELSSYMFRNMDQLFETRTVSRGKSVWMLPRQPVAAMPRHRFDGKDMSYEQFAARTYTNAFLVIRDGKIIFEDYRNRTNAATRFASFSMAKSIVSLLVGYAVAQGHIKSIDDPASDYVPELRSGGYAGVSIRHILQMRSGVDYEERYDFGANPSLAARIHNAAIVENRVRFVDAAFTIGRKAAPGSTFNYATLDTAVLGLVLERATRQPVATYLSERIWKPAGMEADGFWIADGRPGVGRELTGMGYNATLRDYGRLGLLMLQNGVRDGRQILPVGWMKAATNMVPFPDTNALGVKGSYGFQFWKLDSEPDSYAAIGLAGQFIYVHPKSRTIIVKLSHYPVPEPAGLDAEVFAYFRAIATAG